MSVTEPVVAVKRWRDNADMIAEVYRLGRYIKGDVYDVTPGDARGLWTRHIANAAPDLFIGANEAKLDFTALPWPDGKWDTILYDPPYKLNGNPASMPELSSRYGVEVPRRPQDRIDLMVAGLRECARITAPGGHVLAKCQDQVCSGRMWWQTDTLKDAGAEVGLVKVDRFDLIGHSIPQPMGPSERYPNGRRQKHPYGRGSTLLVFRKTS